MSTTPIACGRVWASEIQTGHMSATRTKDDTVPRPIANVFLDRGQSLSVPTMPGRKIQFLGGHARILDDRDLTPILRMANATVVVDEEQIDWIPQWLAKCGEWEPAQCVIEMPDHTKRFPPDYVAIAPEPEPLPVLTPTKRSPGRPRREPDVQDEIDLEDIVRQGWNPQA